MNPVISSVHNQHIKLVRSVFSKRGRKKENLAPLEGIRAIEEAWGAGAVFEQVYVVRSLLETVAGGSELLQELRSSDVEIVWVDESLASEISETESPQGVTALVRPQYAALETVLSSPGTIVVALAGLQDPGNLGTIMRSAECLGARGLVVLPGTVDPYNPKVLRSTAGALFRIPVAEATREQFVASLQEAGYRLAVAEPRSGRPSWQFDWSTPTALVIGNEARGVPEYLQLRADHGVTIPMQGSTESLNAAMAATILLYEAQVSTMRK